MKMTLLLLAVTSFKISAKEQTHTLVMKYFQNDTYTMEVKPSSITTNGDAEPGLYLTSSSSKELGYDNQEKWLKKPSNKESFLLGEHFVNKAQKTLPVRIIFKERKAKEASELMARLLKEAPDKLEITFSSLNGESHFVPMNVHVDALGDKDPAKVGELSYRALEYKVPESAIIIKNLRTKEVFKLSDYIDEKIDRSRTTAAVDAFNNFFGKKKDDSNVIVDTKREPGKAAPPSNTDASKATSSNNGAPR